MSDPAVNSYGILIRDGMITRAMALPYFASRGFSYRRTKRLPAQWDQFPLLNAYFMDEVNNADGDANAGEPRFVANVRVGFSGLIQNNDDEVIEDQLDEMYWALLRGLLQDPTLYKNANFEIESFPRVTRSHHYGASGLNNETPMAELRMEITSVYRFNVPPLITDDFDTIHVETQPLTRYTRYSDSENTIGLGGKEFRVRPSEHPYEIGDMLIARVAGTAERWMRGDVTVIDGDDVTLNVVEVSGTGIANRWRIDNAGNPVLSQYDLEQE